MSSVEQELWNIFTFYTLHGNPLDPGHLRSSQFIKLVRDCQIVGANATEADPPLVEADVQVIYTAEVTRTDRPGARKRPVSERRKMDYNDFLTALMKLSVKAYPRSNSIDDAFQRLLVDNLLPLAARRSPESVAMILANEDIAKLFAYYQTALEQIFTHYASNDARTSQMNASTQAYTLHSSSNFDNQSMDFSTSGMGRAYTQSGKATMRATKGVNSMREALSYAGFLRFATDFELANSVILSTIELGDIFLSSLTPSAPDATIRKLSFNEFVEALLRCALVAYSKISEVSIIDKVRGLFLYMWRAINQKVPKAMDSQFSTNAGDLLAGAMLFNKRFTAQWAVDGYCDYLAPDLYRMESGKAVLSRLLKKDSTSSAALLQAANTALLSPEHQITQRLANQENNYERKENTAPTQALPFFDPNQRSTRAYDTRSLPTEPLAPAHLPPPPSIQQEQDHMGKNFHTAYGMPRRHQGPNSTSSGPEFGY